MEADVQVYELMNGGSVPFDEEAARDLAQRHFRATALKDR